MLDPIYNQSYDLKFINDNMSYYLSFYSLFDVKLCNKSPKNHYSYIFCKISLISN